MSVPVTWSVTQAVAGEVRAHIARKRRSGRSVALELGWTQPYMSRRLNGIVPFDVEDLAAIADVLGVPVVAFFDARGGPALRREGTGVSAGQDGGIRFVQAQCSLALAA